MSTRPPDVVRPARPLALAGIALTGAAAGGLVGAATNAVNGRVSPAYFVTILRWEHVEDVWRAAVAQGIFEGTLLGAMLGVVFAAVVAYLTGASCLYGFALKHLLGVVGGVLGCWALGGLLAVGLAALSPGFYRAAIRGVPGEFGPMLAYAWVGGSIMAAQLGGPPALLLGLLAFRAGWRRRTGYG